MLKNRHKFNINGIVKNISTFFDLFYTIPLTTQINKKPFIRRVQRVFGELVGNTILRTSKLHILLKYSLNTQIKLFLILL